jgi:putative PEP-CTERM system TPR-repeat lipoprotein
LLSLAFAPLLAVGTEVANEAYEKAVQAYEEGDHQTSYLHLKNALQQDPNLLSARLLLAQLYFNEGDIYSAEKESAEALLLGADINLVLPIYGQSLLLQEKVDELLEIEKVSSSFTVNSQFEWALLKGQAYLLRQEPALARDEFDRAAQIMPNNVRANNAIAAIYMNSGQLDEAIAVVEKSLALDADNAKTWQLRGELAMKQKSYDSALAYFHKGFALEPDDIRIQRSLAQAYMEMGDREETRRYLDMILEQSPEDPAATLITAILLIGDGDSELGDSMLANLSSKLSQFDEGQRQSDSILMFIRASAEYIQGNDPSAIALLNAYLLKNKSDLAAIRLLADLYLRNDDMQRAAELLSSRESDLADDPGLSIQLMSLYVHTGNIYRAKILLDTLRENGLGENPYVVMLEAELLRMKEDPGSALVLLDGQEFETDEPLGYQLLRGVLQLELSKFDDAQLTVKRLQKDFPNNIRVYNFSAVAYLTLGSLSEAQASIEKALAVAPDNIEARFNQAMLHKKRGEFEASRNILKDIAEELPSHTRALMLMARIAFLQGRYDEAIAWSDRVFAYDTASVAANELQLEIYSTTENWESAKLIAQRLVNEHPRDSKYLLELATIAMRLEDRELAENTVSRLYPMWKEDPEKLIELAELQTRFNIPAGARKSIEQALTLDAEAYPIRIALARLDYNEGEYDKALVMAEALQEQWGVQADTSLLLGDIALARGELDKASEYFLTAFQLDASSGEAIARIYSLSMQRSQPQAFTDLMEETLKESSLPVLAVRLMADSYLVQDKNEQAALYYEKLLDLESFAADPIILNNLANIYAKTDLDKALATALKGLETAGENNAALPDTVGWILAQQGENEKALSYLRKAFARNSTDPEIRYHLGVVLIALGRGPEGAKELRAAVSSEQPFPHREDAMRLIAEQAE